MERELARPDRPFTARKYQYSNTFTDECAGCCHTASVYHVI